MNFGAKFGISPRMWRLIAVLCGAVIVGIVGNWPIDVPDHISGQARVIDGDSLRVAGDEVRLVGIDAPEWKQICRRHGSDWACGRAARTALQDKIDGRRIACEVEGVDRYDRLLAVCSAGGQELNLWMVKNGWAVAYGRYRTEERRASKARIGIWDSEFDRPKVWRDENMTGAVAASAS